MPSVNFDYADCNHARAARLRTFRSTPMFFENHALRLAIALTLSLGGASSLQAQEIRMGIPEVLRDYAPLAEDLLQQSGLPYRFSFYPAQRSFNALVSGEVDAEFSRTQSAFASDQSEFVMIGPIGCAEISAYRMTGSAASLGQVGDLANYRVAVLNGSIAVIKFLRKRHASLTLAVNGEALYRMLEAHHVDLVVDAPLQSIGAVKALHMQDRVEVTGPPVLTEPAFLILNSRFAAWRPKLQATLDGLKKSGQWQQHFGDINEKRGLPRNTAMSCLEH